MQSFNISPFKFGTVIRVRLKTLDGRFRVEKICPRIFLHIFRWRCSTTSGVRLTFCSTNDVSIAQNNTWRSERRDEPSQRSEECQPQITVSVLSVVAKKVGTRSGVPVRVWQWIVLLFQTHPKPSDRQKQDITYCFQ